MTLTVHEINERAREIHAERGFWHHVKWDVYLRLFAKLPDCSACWLEAYRRMQHTDDCCWDVGYTDPDCPGCKEMWR